MKIELRKFADWLRSKKPDQVVGKRRSCTGCPVANFYSEATGGHEIVVSENGDGYRIDRGGGERLPPAWVANFFLAVDHEPTEKITARRALELLEQC
jgi:hypothetical protein